MIVALIGIVVFLFGVLVGYWEGRHGHSGRPPVSKLDKAVEGLIKASRDAFATMDYAWGTGHDPGYDLEVIANNLSKAIAAVEDARKEKP